LLAKTAFDRDGSEVAEANLFQAREVGQSCHRHSLSMISAQMMQQMLEILVVQDIFFRMKTKR
jgi:hypothetical protein